ncbi:uncharacterized protein LOC142353138 [Convolutriloba macropyga]|uniref:uncharacterized protein LOC142353138 n=1 Tax=Convolutriloba macropyga TaxID=536237 RepID=UPI003F51BAF9
MPYGCGTHVAFWLCGNHWPYDGEIDIVEGIDGNIYDVTTLHTSAGCNFQNVTRNFTGNVKNSENCDVYETANTGCGIQSSNPASYGNHFNSAGGGLYALEWTVNGIRAWFWNEGLIPTDALGSSPAPDTWGVPYASFPFGDYCPQSMFNAQRIITGINFCGDWDGAAFPAHCPGKGTCENFVQNNPQAFEKAFWQIHWLRVFGET